MFGESILKSRYNRLVHFVFADVLFGASRVLCGTDTEGINHLAQFAEGTWASFIAV